MRRFKFWTLISFALGAAAWVGCSGSVPREPDLRTATALANEPTATATIAASTPVPTRVADTPSPTAQPPTPETSAPPQPAPDPTTVEPTATATAIATAVPIIDPDESPVTTFGLFLEVVGLGEENIVRGSTLFLSGRVSSDAVLSVNGVIIPVDTEGVFGVNLSLSPGPNLLEVVASDLAGNTESKVITVISLVE